MFRVGGATGNIRLGLEAEAPVKSRRAFFGSLALAAVNTGRLLLQMLVLPILARMLGPAAFGLVSLAMPFILFASLLSDGGMGTALVRQADPSPEVESTVFWLSAGIGAAIALALCLLAAPVAWALGQPSLAPILIALAPILILCSSLSVANARISRARHFGLFAIGDLLSMSLSSGAAIAAALAGCGAWSLVIQQLTLWVAKAAWVLTASRFRPAFVCRPGLAKALLSFGLNNVGANIADFLGRSAPALVIGSTLGVVAVGHYAMAYQLIRAPDLVLSGPLLLATFTAVAGLAATPPEARRLSLRTLRLLASVLAPLFVGLMLTADLLVGIFLGPRWQEAAPVLAALAPAGFFLCLYSVIGAVLMGLGRSDLQFRLALACGCAMLVGVVVGSRLGLLPAAFGVSAGAAIAAPLYLAVLAQRLGGGWAEVTGAVVRPLLAAAVMAVAVSLVRQHVGAELRSAQFVVAVLVGAAVFAVALAAVSGRQLLDDVRRIAPARPLAAPVAVVKDPLDQAA